MSLHCPNHLQILCFDHLRFHRQCYSFQCLSLVVLVVLAVLVVQITEDTASQSWRVPRCTELNAAESKRHLNLQRQISGVRQARQPTPVRGKRKGGTPSSILKSPVPGGTNLFHRLGVWKTIPRTEFALVNGTLASDSKAFRWTLNHRIVIRKMHTGTRTGKGYWNYRVRGNRP